jgi:hypothetical protein
METGRNHDIGRFDAIAEKDLDLMLLEEFCSSKHWCQWFYDRLRAAKPELPELAQLEVNAARSVSGMGSDGRAGETDILVVLEGSTAHDRECVIVLVEDKISASFTPDQPQRYADAKVIGASTSPFWRDRPRCNSYRELCFDKHHLIPFPRGISLDTCNRQFVRPALWHRCSIVESGDENVFARKTTLGHLGEMLVMSKKHDLSAMR